VPLAVAVTVAWPSKFVTTVPAESVADAPAPGAVNVTGTHGSGAQEASVTVTVIGLGNAEPGDVA